MKQYHTDQLDSLEKSIQDMIDLFIDRCFGKDVEKILKTSIQSPIIDTKQENNLKFRIDRAINETEDYSPQLKSATEEFNLAKYSQIIDKIADKKRKFDFKFGISPDLIQKQIEKFNQIYVNIEKSYKLNENSVQKVKDASTELETLRQTFMNRMNSICKDIEPKPQAPRRQHAFLIVDDSLSVPHERKRYFTNIMSRLMLENRNNHQLHQLFQSINQYLENIYNIEKALHRMDTKIADFQPFNKYEKQIKNQLYSIPPTEQHNKMEESRLQLQIISNEWKKSNEFYCGIELKKLFDKINGIPNTIEIMPDDLLVISDLATKIETLRRSISEAMRSLNVYELRKQLKEARDVQSLSVFKTLDNHSFKVIANSLNTEIKANIIRVAHTKLTQSIEAQRNAIDHIVIDQNNLLNVMATIFKIDLDKPVTKQLKMVTFQNYEPTNGMNFDHISFGTMIDEKCNSFLLETSKSTADILKTLKSAYNVMFDLYENFKKVVSNLNTDSYERKGDSVLEFITDRRSNSIMRLAKCLESLKRFCAADMHDKIKKAIERINENVYPEIDRKFSDSLPYDIREIRKNSNQIENLFNKHTISNLLNEISEIRKIIEKLDAESSVDSYIVTQQRLQPHIAKFRQAHFELSDDIEKVERYIPEIKDLVMKLIEAIYKEIYENMPRLSPEEVRVAVKPLKKPDEIIPEKKILKKNPDQRILIQDPLPSMELYESNDEDTSELLAKSSIQKATVKLSERPKTPAISLPPTVSSGKE